ncbi:MAG: FIST N-terminal domain-containing protein [Phycisphaerae bacterium]
MNTTPGNYEKVAIAVVHHETMDQVATDLTAQLRRRLGPDKPDLVILFASPHYIEKLDLIAADLQRFLEPVALIGAAAETVIAGDREFEGEPAVVVWAARWTGVGIRSFHLSHEQLADLESNESYRDHLNLPADVDPSFVLIGDPFSFPASSFLASLHDAFPKSEIVGGLASAADEPGKNVLIFDGHPMHFGMVGVAIWGNLRFETLVSQGCRPIGRHMIVTRAEQNVIQALGGRAPLQVVNEMIQECSKRDVELMKKRGLLVGRVINEQRAKFTQGDFLIRSPLGFDKDSGALVINDLVRIGQTIQFQVRDAGSAARDLEEMLEPKSGIAFSGGLLFTCNGRGSRLFSQQDRDAKAIMDALGSPPLAGMSCAGEIGPIGGTPFLHGHTACVGLLASTTSS